MSYQLLKINNVTKLCDDRILLDEENNILDIQWFDFQLRALCEKLEVSLENKSYCPQLYHSTNPRPSNSNYTNLFTRNQIFRALKHKYSSVILEDSRHEIITIPDTDIVASKVELEEFGFSNEKKLLLFKKTFNLDNKCEVLPKSLVNDETVKVRPYYTDDQTQFEQITKDIPDEIEYNADDFGDENIDSLSTDRGKQSARGKKEFPKKKPGKKKPGKKKQLSACEKYGKLKWDRNSCYMDSPIYLLFTRMLQFPEADLSKHLMGYEFKMDDLNSKRCFAKSDTGQFTPLGKSDSMPILKEIFIEFKKVFTNFSTGTAGDLNELRQLLSNCGGILTEKWGSPDTQDSDEFLFDLLEILQVKIPKQINGQISSSRTNKSKLYHFSDKNSNNASVIRFADYHGYTNLPKFHFENGDGTAKYDAIVEKPAEYVSQVQQFIISGNHLQHLFRFDTELNALQLSPLNSVVIADEYKYYNEMIGLSFKTDDRGKVDEIIRTRELSIMDMMRITEITNFKDIGAKPTYHFHDSKYTTNDHDTFYFQKDDTEDPPKMLSLKNIEKEKHGFEKTLSVELTELDNNSSDIFITVGRIVGYYNQTKKVTVQLKLNFKISEFNFLVIEGTKYNLHGLVYWQGDDAGGGGHYMTVFNCKGIFFDFDDLDGGSITKIGSYEELLAYKGGTILTHSVIYHYIRGK